MAAHTHGFSLVILLGSHWSELVYSPKPDLSSSVQRLGPSACTRYFIGKQNAMVVKMVVWNFRLVKIVKTFQLVGGQKQKQCKFCVSVPMASVRVNKTQNM